MKYAAVGRAAILERLLGCFLWSTCIGLGSACSSAERTAAPGTRAADQPFADEEAIRALLVDQQEAWNRGDLEGFMRGYWNSPDLVFTSGGRVHRGYVELLERYRTNYKDRNQMGHLTFSRLEIHPLGSDAAWALGRWDLERNTDPVGGAFTLVMRRFPSGWAIVHDHTSVDAEIPARRSSYESGGRQTRDAGKPSHDRETTEP